MASSSAPTPLPPLPPLPPSVAFVQPPISPIILGTNSLTRRQILDSLNVSYTKLVVPIDERSIGTDLRNTGTVESADKLVSLLASSKADAVFNSLNATDGAMATVTGTLTVARRPGCYILTSDQVVVHCDKGILEKPGDVESAQGYIDAYKCAPTLTTVGSVQITHWPSSLSASRLFHGEVNFDKASLTAYDSGSGRNDSGSGRLLSELISQNAPVLNCAGGLMIENSLVQKFIVSIRDEDSVLGLSRVSFIEALEECEDMVKKKPEWK
jgi:septum formation protein